MQKSTFYLESSRWWWHFC